MIKPWLFKKISQKSRLALLLICLIPGLSFFETKYVYGDEMLAVLDEQAIPVKVPNHVLLVGITRVENRLVAVGEQGVIIYSDDSGISWRQSKVPVSVTITSVAFINKNDGWAAGDCGVILHTVDGGISWQTQLTGFQVNKMQVATASKFFEENSGGAAAQTAVRRASIFMNAGADKPFLSVLPISTSKIMVFGAYRMAVVSNDAGQNWSDISLNIGDPVSHNLYAAVVIDNETYLASETGIVLRSTDGGVTYPQVALPEPYTLFGIMGTPKNAILTFGVGGNIFRSVDQGKSWSQASLNTNANLTAGIVLLSGHILITDESGGVFISIDDGITFRRMQENQGMALYGVTQATNGDVVLAGDTGIRVIQSTDF
jgi:photosystem II stability/assembly factor-like uncharacterized protein